ncbi:hypothetical protein [Dactylosporangium sp. NPDC005555]|uniref:hypothetical protein n=1 Tax=Dactylosporangium sp. NPDC005555 TaxID=3154889 RepID=UPI0033B4E499
MTRVTLFALLPASRRFGFFAIAAINTAWGFWAVSAPHRFFATFPGFGLHWTAAYPPYNQHLIVDLGATMLMIAVLCGTAAVLDRPATSWMAGAATAVFGTLHFGYHALHAGHMGATDRVLSLLSLVAGAVVPPVLAATHLPFMQRRR